MLTYAFLVVQNSYRFVIPFLPFSGPKSSENQKIVLFKKKKKRIWQQNLAWTNIKLFIVFIIPLSVNIYTFHHKNINGFVYSILSQTLPGMFYNTQNQHHIAFLKLKKKSEFSKTSNPSGLDVGFIDVG